MHAGEWLVDCQLSPSPFLCFFDTEHEQINTVPPIQMSPLSYLALVHSISVCAPFDNAFRIAGISEAETTAMVLFNEEFLSSLTDEPSIGEDVQNKGELTIEMSQRSSRFSFSLIETIEAAYVMNHCTKRRFSSLTRRQMLICQTAHKDK